MPSVQIGKYKRPGIYIEEFDNSVIDTPNVEGLRTLIIGSSKTGSVNTPIVLNSQTDLQKVFGDLDRSLESKGSYFHRTISKVLENSPVIAMNLLNPDDELDQLEYKSLSTSTGYSNDIKREAPYSRFFDTSSFWKKDRESFLGITQDNPNDNQRIMHFTNFDDREITVFVVKSSASGYDSTLLDWYGSVDKVPLYLDPKDYASDYLVDVVVIAGNWTNYSELSIDPVWSQYFNNSGLIKSQLFNFSNDSSVNTLQSWIGLSLIPYFRDSVGTNIFIENKINAQTDVTGLFCAFDMDAVETDYRNGLLDILGNSLINDNEAESVDFLSYNEDIKEVIEYPHTLLDRPGNVHSFDFNGYYNTTINRTSNFSEGIVLFTVGPASSTGATGATFGVDYTVTGSGYAVIGGTKLDLADTSFVIEASEFNMNSSVDGSTQNFTKVFFVDSDGGIKTDPTNSQLVSGIVLGYIDVEVEINSNVKTFNNVDYTPISIDDSGFIYFDSSTEIKPTANTNEDTLTYEFVGTSGVADIHDYKTYRVWKAYNQFVSILDSVNSDQASILVDEGSPSNGGPWKRSISDIIITIVSNTSSNNTISFGGFDTGYFAASATIMELNGVVIYTIDDESILELYGGTSTVDYVGPTYGVIGEYSGLYTDYENGIINTGDYFYENLIDGLVNGPENSDFEYVQFLDDGLGNDYLVFDKTVNFDNNGKVIIPESTLNTGIFTIMDNVPVSAGLTGASGVYYGYPVSENTVAETVTNPTKVWDTLNKHYLKMWKDGDLLNVQFTDETLTSPSITYNIESSIDVHSQDSNFRQSVEIEEPVGYVSGDNVILVDGARYSEVKIGDFLEAYVDDSNLEIGEVPRSMTRVLSKKTYVGDPTLSEITCDAAIRVYDYDGDKQTYRFTQIDDYASTYKGISLFGFRVRKESMPNGTEERLTDILNIVGKGTPLYNAITDKDIIDFRYLVDSYGLGLTENSKQALADIVGKRLDAFGIINMPSMKSFRNSSSPTFTDDENRLDTGLIAIGGDPDSSPAFNYSLAEGDGKSCVAYFTPYVVVNDNGRPKEVPPSAWIATTFLRKHNSAITSVTPWTIAAGITDGQVTGIAGLEYPFTGEDIENLNGMKVNPIVSKRNRGRVIETENTAQTLVTSALSFIHVREVLIELERQLADMLLTFQWKYNTPEIRAEIKLRADTICEDYVNRNGLYNFFNKCDGENNTQEIIDNQMGVLDTYVEPIKGMGVIVNNVTILKTGGVNSGGFL